MKRVGLLLLLAACSTADDAGPEAPPPTLPVTVAAIEVGVILPGSVATVRGSGFLEDAIYAGVVQAAVDGRAVELLPEVRRVDDLTLHVVFDAATVDAAGAGQLEGNLNIEVRLGEAVGTGVVAISARIAPALDPVISQVASGVFPASPVVVVGQDFIAGEEGQTLVSLRGEFVVNGGPTKGLDVADVIAAPQTLTGWRRDMIEFDFLPTWVGIRPGSFSGEIRVINAGAAGWRGDSGWQPVRFDLLRPFVEDVQPRAASRGQSVRIDGQGFLGGAAGLTNFRLDGVFATAGGAMVNTPPGGVLVTPNWRSGTEMVFSLNPNYDLDCESTDLGAVPGVLTGTATPTIVFGEEQVEGAPFELAFEILPTRQVVYLRFLPAFIDSLRLFGLRNLSGLVKDRVVEVVERDYRGINVEVRLQEPTDFLRYSTVEIGGPDPNSQQLFGLDNTTGLDRCNKRLDDNLAGQNADSNGAYGGVFVESFLQLSPRVGDNPLANELFDEIFRPVIDRPVDSDEYPGGARDAVIERAVRTLGSLVGNTVTHEIGHSLGLPVAAGCGQYHNGPGDRQIMDCGIDRPFEERAEITEGGHAVWTGENRAYLERILPLP